MAFVSTKTIKGRKQNYLEKSIRLPNGNTKKFSIYLKDFVNNKKEDYLKFYENKLEENIKNYLVLFASNYYDKKGFFVKKEIAKLEEMKLSYNKIISNLSKKQFEDIIDRFTVNFTYESNAIEGNSLTLKDVTIIIRENKVLKNKDLREVYETLNTRDAMDLVFNNKLKINHADIKKLHKELVKNTGVEFGYKKFPNFLLGRDLKTVAPEKVEIEMNKLIDWSTENKSMHPIQKAAIFHGRFEKIHPFEDGNGRVGRLLINVILMNEGFTPLIIRKSQRLSYFSCLEAFDNGYETKLTRFLIEKYKNTYRKFFEIYYKYL